MTTKSIHLSPNDFDNLLWCATRYCIGRHSYVSGYAQDFWHIIQSNRGLLKEDRLKFFACDIRAEVSNRINYYGNISVQHSYNDCIKYDALTLLASYAREHPEQKEHETFYEVDCLTGEVNTSPWTLENQRSYSLPFQVCNEIDLPYWVLLANCIDRQYEVTLNCNGNERKELCVKHPVIGGKYTVVSNWGTCVCNQFIVDVKPLFFQRRVTNEKAICNMANTVGR